MDFRLSCDATANRGIAQKLTAHSGKSFAAAAGAMSGAPIPAIAIPTLRPWFRERMAFLLGFLERGRGPAKCSPLLLVVPISELKPAHGI